LEVLIVNTSCLHLRLILSRVLISTSNSFVQGSSVGHVNAAQPACSTAASADSILSTKTEPNLCITAKQSQSSLSFSGINEDGGAGDYQDCGASSMLLMGEPPWLNTCPENELQLQSANRCSAVMRYKEKKKTRK